MEYGSRAPQLSENAAARAQGLQRSACELTVIQQPENACLNVAKDKDRKTVDPPPVVQLQVSQSADPRQQYMQTDPGPFGPYYFMSCSLVSTVSSAPAAPSLGGGPSTQGAAPQGAASSGQGVASLAQALTGNTVSSLHRLKDTENKEGAFFVFGDLSAKVEGSYRLEFNLFEMREDGCVHVATVTSNPFTVFAKKNFPGMMESTPLTRTFADQGVRLRLRKEPRTLLRKRGPASDEYEPRHYKTSKRKADDQDSQSSGYSQAGTSSQHQIPAPTYNLEQPASLASSYPHLQHLSYNPQQGTIAAQQELVANALQGARMYATAQSNPYPEHVPSGAYQYPPYAHAQQHASHYATMQSYPQPSYAGGPLQPEDYVQQMPTNLPHYGQVPPQEYPIEAQRYIGGVGRHEQMLMPTMNPYQMGPGQGPPQAMSMEQYDISRSAGGSSYDQGDTGEQGTSGGDRSSRSTPPVKHEYT